MRMAAKEKLAVADRQAGDSGFADRVGRDKIELTAGSNDAGHTLVGNEIDVTIRADG